MSGPKRIQRKRTKGWRMPLNTVYVGRGSRFGNPYKVGAVVPESAWLPLSASDAVALYAEMAEEGWRHFGIGWLQPLRGMNLACWCPLAQPCHGDVLLELANA